MCIRQHSGTQQIAKDDQSVYDQKIVKLKVKKTYKDGGEGQLFIANTNGVSRKAKFSLGSRSDLMFSLKFNLAQLFIFRL